MNEDDKEIKIDLKWFDDLLANTNGISQLDLFPNQGAATITGVAGSSGSVDYVAVAGSGTGLGGVGSSSLSWGSTLTNSTGGYVFQSPSISNGGTGNLYPNISLGGGTWDTNWGSKNNGLKVIGDAEFDGDVKIKGKSITEMFEKIEEKLAILHPNEELEAKWEKLRELRKQYIELEKEILQKEKMWEILKR